MKTLKEFLETFAKQHYYTYYKKVISKPKKMAEVTNMEMYDAIIDLYKEDPEVIIQLCNIEEMQILNNLIDFNIKKEGLTFLDYCHLVKLQKNFLIIAGEKEYYIPSDILNYIKMALNLYDEEKEVFTDVANNTILGLIRIHATQPLPTFIKTLEKYKQFYTEDSLRLTIKKSLYLKDKVDIIKYQNEPYVVSLEFHNCQKLIHLTAYNITPPYYKLEEIVSIGKYHVDLFKQPILQFISLLESHMEANPIYGLVNRIIFYAGCGLDDPEDIRKIACDIEELYQGILKVLPYLPVWIYNGCESKLINLKGEQ